jgi:hypothetical protein
VRSSRSSNDAPDRRRINPENQWPSLLRWASTFIFRVPLDGEAQYIRYCVEYKSSLLFKRISFITIFLSVSKHIFF